MPLSVYAPGKLVLIGEYSVLHGAPAVVAAIDRRVMVEIAPRNERSHLSMLHLGLSGLPLDASANLRKNKLTPNQRSQVRYVRAIIDHFRHMVDFGKTAPPPMDITVDAGPLFSEKGVKFGLGSSAALTVALMAGLYAHARGLRPERALLFKHALTVHRHLQGGVGSGIDIAASVYGGFSVFQRPHGEGDRLPRIRQIAWPADLKLMAVWTGKPASTAQLLSALEKFSVDKSDDFRIKMAQLGDTALRGTRALERDDAQSFIDAANEHYRRLAQLSARSDVPIVTADDKRLADMTRNGGGGYKPSGAGGGDVGLVFTDSQSRLDALHQIIADAGYQIMKFQWGAPGVIL